MLFLFMLLVSVVGCFVEWVEELCVNYVKNVPTFVKKRDQHCVFDAWRGLGEVLGALAVPLGGHGGSKSGF